MQIGAASVEPLVAVLNNRDKFFQREAVEALGEIGDERAVEPLVATLKDMNEYVRNSAAEALGKIGDKRAVEPLVAALKEQRYHDIREAAARALGKIGDKRAVEPLVATLKDMNGYVRGIAAGALGKIGDAQAVLPLVATLKDMDKYVRSSAAWALGKIGDKRAVEPLVTVLKDKYFNVRRSAAEALGEIGDKRAVEPLVAALKEQRDYNIREEAAQALGKIAVEPLMAVLKDKNLNVRRTAAEALDQLGWRPINETQRTWYAFASGKWEEKLSLGIASVEPLVAALRHGERWSIQTAAAEALGKIGDKRAVEPLVATLKDMNKYVRRSAAKALGEIGDEQAVDPLGAVLRNCIGEYKAEVESKAYWSGNMYKMERMTEEAMAMAEALGNIGGKRAVELLAAALKEGNTDVQKAAVNALVQIGAASVEPLVAVLRDVERWGGIQAAAAEALGEIGDERAVEPLIAALKDVREEAAKALGKIGDKRAVEPLVSVLRNEMSEWKAGVREFRIMEAEAVAEALGKIGEMQAVEPLLEALKTGKHTVATNINYSRVEVKAGIEKTFAEVTVRALIIILEADVANISLKTLRLVAELDHVTSIEYQFDKCNSDTLMRPFDCSQLRQIARQELIRRGLEA